ncbi:hypothetical protein KQR54_18840 [Mycobacterium gordonae]|nr:hypothetical protein [Mycobacterium gordonae]
MEANDAKLQVVRILIDDAIQTARKIKAETKKLDQLKARIQTHAFAEICDKNIKHARVYGNQGHVNVTYKSKFELVNFERLERAIGSIATDHVLRVEAVEYDINDGFKAALIALIDDDYGKDITIEDVLRGLGLDEKQVKTGAKRLKGVYGKDKKVLESFGVTGECEEELDAIRRYKTAELVDIYFGQLSPLQLEEIQRCVIVEQELAIGLEYES